MEEMGSVLGHRRVHGGRSALGGASPAHPAALSMGLKHPSHKCASLQL